MNKGRKDFLKWKACERKRAYDTKEDAFQKGQQSYLCRYCGKWHRSGELGKLVARLLGKGKR